MRMRRLAVLVMAAASASVLARGQAQPQAKGGPEEGR